MDNVTLMVGGIQGDGIVSIGNSIIKLASRTGYYSYGYRTFSSRIKGGNTNYSITIDDKKVLSCDDYLDILIAFDKETISLNIDKLKENSLVIYDSILNIDFDINCKVISFPFTSLAKENGTTLMKNTSALGVIINLLNLNVDEMKNILNEKFKNKGSSIVEKNIDVLTKSYDSFSSNNLNDYKLSISNTTSKKPSMIGNDAIGLASLFAGCRFMSSYPITPASEVMEFLTKKFPKYNGIMIQTEDEISAITMAIGASYAGTRSITATSGPGISLMMEAISLAGMTETPIVIVDVQRGGPSTGLPTKHEQSDINSVYYGSYGEIPSIVLTPYDVEECFYQTINAFNLADIYQCPVFILSDLNLGLARQTIDEIDKERIVINRGELIDSIDENTTYKRFQVTDNGISKRAIPGTKNGLHHVTGIEHIEEGKPFEGAENRKQSMDKRLRKTKELENVNNIDIYGNIESNILVLSIGSNYGIIKRAIENNNLNISYGSFKMIKPLPKKQLNEIFNRYEKILVVENNATGQLATILKAEINHKNKIYSMLKYDGTPFKSSEIKSKLEELI